MESLLLQPAPGMAGAPNNAMRQLGASPRRPLRYWPARRVAAAVLATVFATAAVLLRTRNVRSTLPMTTQERTA